MKIKTVILFVSKGPGRVQNGTIEEIATCANGSFIGCDSGEMGKIEQLQIPIPEPGDGFKTAILYNKRRFVPATLAAIEAADPDSVTFIPVVLEELSQFRPLMILTDELENMMSGKPHGVVEELDGYDDEDYDEEAAEEFEEFEEEAEREEGEPFPVEPERQAARSPLTEQLERLGLTEEDAMRLLAEKPAPHPDPTGRPRRKSAKAKAKAKRRASKGPSKKKARRQRSPK